MYKRQGQALALLVESDAVNQADNAYLDFFAWDEPSTPALRARLRVAFVPAPRCTLATLTDVTAAAEQWAWTSAMPGFLTQYDLDADLDIDIADLTGLADAWAQGRCL